MNVKEGVAVITGAGSGIGRAVAMSLARRGCHLALADVQRAGLEETVSQARSHGVRVTAHVLDVADRDAVKTFPEAVLAEHGKVDLLINNAGVAIGGTFEQVSETDFDWLMEINFHGVVRMTRAFLPLLRLRPAARIVNLSSVYGLVSPAGQSAYSASKFAVRGFSNALRHELEGSPVGVTVVHPGGVATAIAKSARAPAGADPTEIARQRELSNKMLRMPPERAGEIIVRGIERDQARVIVGADAKVLSLIERIMPVTYWSLLKKAYPK
jgi:short-subunit dehydrogenase